MVDALDELVIPGVKRSGVRRMHMYATHHNFKAAAGNMAKKPFMSHHG